MDYVDCKFSLVCVCVFDTKHAALIISIGKNSFPSLCKVSALSFFIIHLCCTSAFSSSIPQISGALWRWSRRTNKSTDSCFVSLHFFSFFPFYSRLYNSNKANRNSKWNKSWMSKQQLWLFRDISEKSN